MDLQVREKENVLIVDLEGRLVAGTSEEALHEAMNRLVAEGHKNILLNLSEVEWIDSSGIGELVASIKLARRFGSSVKLLRMGDRVRHVLSVSQLLPLLDVYEKEEDAVEAFQQESQPTEGT